jgi:acyl carrier protein
MNDQDIKTTLLKLLQKIAPEIEPDLLDDDEDIRETYGIDSYDFLQFIVGLDEAYGIETPEDDYGKISTLRALIDYIKLAKEQT